MQYQPTNVDFWWRWLLETSSGDHLEAWRGVMCVLRWLAIREANSIPPPGRSQNLEDDVTHSRLLRRLIAGKEPLPTPPPESFGHPWYELIEGGGAEGVEVQQVGRDGGAHLVINQGIWRVLFQPGPDEWIVSYREGEAPFRLTRRGGVWRLERLAPAPKTAPGA